MIRRVGMIAFAVAMAAAGAADAQTDGAQAVAEQRRLFEEANHLYDAGKLPEAEAKYLAAWSMNKTFDVGGNLGTVELKMGKARAAAEHFAYALRAFPTGGSLALRQKVTERFAEAKTQVVTVHVRVNVDGASVDVDGAPIGQAPLADDVFVEPGQHVLHASLAGHAPAEVAVSGAKGEARDVELRLVANARGPNLIVLVSGAVLTAAALGTGIGLRVAAGSKQSSAESSTTALEQTRGPSPCSGAFAGDPQCSAIQSALDASGHLKTASTVAFIGAGVFGAATITYAILARSKSPRPTTGVRFIPQLGLGTTGLLAHGSF